ncbi:hypothetical protein COLO4_09452 [Corchorus olitorius]|uniref:F-box domain-containing protein n=1 Tax=Corchorus olitorius TaxID=93759 RepID=A0A1R3KC21_9ROSI|nr:hypothetical protein COLO4_09452 [Corchorus olitorius]
MSDYLPEKTVLDILHRLPIKTLVKCTSVCKAWNSLIKSPTFIYTHLDQTISSDNDDDTHFFLLRLRQWHLAGPWFLLNQYFLGFEYEDEYGFDLLKELEFPLGQRCCNRFYFIVGCCNGLVCVTDNHNIHLAKNFILWNPIIRKAIVVPEYSSTLSATYGFVGFGFDSRNNDFKLLRFVQRGHVKKKHRNVPVEVQVYSLNSNSWKNITHIASNYGLLPEYEPQYGHSFVNGAINFFASYDRNQKYSLYSNHMVLVLGFNLSEEIFYEIPLPEGLNHHPLCLTNPIPATLLKYGESSIAVLNADQDYIDLYIMEEYGIASSWTKVSLNNLLNWVPEGRGQVPRVLGFRKNGEILLEMDGDLLNRKGKYCLTSCEIESEELTVFNIEDVGRNSFYDSFVESLVLLDKGGNGDHGAMLDFGF